MKKMMLFLFLFVCSTVFGQQANQVSHALKNEAAFKGMLQTKPGIKGKSSVKFDICDDNMNIVTTDTTQMAVKVWFTDGNGKPYHPAKHRFNPKEKFDVWVEASCPVYVSLFQNYFEDRPESRLVYPDEKYPKTYSVLPKGKPVKLPVNFVMDDDMRSEIMSIVVAKADFNATAVANFDLNQTVIGDNNQITNTIIGYADTVVPGNQNTVQETIIKGLKNFHKSTQYSKKGSIKFNICSGNCIQTTESGYVSYNNDVCAILFGSAKIAQYQLTLHK